MNLFENLIQTCISEDPQDTPSQEFLKRMFLQPKASFSPDQKAVWELTQHLAYESSNLRLWTEPPNGLDRDFKKLIIPWYKVSGTKGVYLHWHPGQNLADQVFNWTPGGLHETSFSSKERTALKKMKVALRIKGTDDHESEDEEANEFLELLDNGHRALASICRFGAPGDQFGRPVGLHGRGPFNSYDLKNEPVQATFMKFFSPMKSLTSLTETQRFILGVLVLGYTCIRFRNALYLSMSFTRGGETSKPRPSWLKSDILTTYRTVQDILIYLKPFSKFRIVKENFGQMALEKYLKDRIGSKKIVDFANTRMILDRSYLKIPFPKI